MGRVCAAHIADCGAGVSPSQSALDAANLALEQSKLKQLELEHQATIPNARSNSRRLKKIDKQRVDSIKRVSGAYISRSYSQFAQKHNARRRKPWHWRRARSSQPPLANIQLSRPLRSSPHPAIPIHRSRTRSGSSTRRAHPTWVTGVVWTHPNYS